MGDMGRCSVSEMINVSVRLAIEGQHQFQYGWLA
jgi:hypothetical protein